jgi:hypothetical protein
MDDHAAHKTIQSADRPHRNQQERQKAVEEYSTAERRMSVSVRVRVRVRARVSLPVVRIVLMIMITCTEVQRK